MPLNKHQKQEKGEGGKVTLTLSRTPTTHTTHSRKLEKNGYIFIVCVRILKVLIKLYVF